MKTALIVDDSAVIRKVGRRILEMLDFQVRDVEDAEQALDLCGEAPPDLVLLDGSLPGMGAYAFIKALRACVDGERPRIVFCTSENEVGAIARALRAGADAYLMKPFDREAISTKLEQLGYRRAADAA